MKKFLILGILICAFSIFGTYGQNLSSSSKNNDDKNIVYLDSITTLNILSRDLIFIDQEKSMEYAQTALHLSLEHNYKTGEAYAYRNMSNLNVINEIYFLGMDYIQKSLTIFQNQNDSIGIADCYISLGHLYRGLNNIEDEIRYFELSYDIFNKLNIPSRIGVAAHNLGESYYKNNEYDNSKRLTLIAIELNKSTGQTSVMSSCYKVLGLNELSINNYDKAETYFKIALEVSEQLGKNSQKSATLESMINIAEIYKIRKQHDKQIKYLNQAVEFSKTYNLPIYLPTIYHEMLLHYTEVSDKEMVLKYITEQKIVSESIQINSLKDKTNLVNNLILLHSLEKENKFLEQTEILQKESIELRNLLLLFTLILSILLIWFVIKLIHVNNKIKTTNQTLKLQNETIKNQNTKLEVLIATRDKLFSIIAHDLRSPFNSILGFSDLLLENIKNNDLSETTHHIQLINRNATATLIQLENLLEWAKNQTGQINIQKKRLALNPFIFDIVASVESSADYKSIDVEYNPSNEIEIFADQNLLRTIILNLVQNAIKFTHPKGKIVISSIKKQDNIEISISDNGIGMSQEIIDGLFVIGKTEVTVGTENEKGSGLGLILCKEFIEKHNGKLWVKSKFGQGSTFSFTIPTTD